MMFSVRGLNYRCLRACVCVCLHNYFLVQHCSTVELVNVALGVGLQRGKLKNIDYNHNLKNPQTGFMVCLLSGIDNNLPNR